MEDLELVESLAQKEIDARKGEIKNIGELDIRILAIHDRVREYLPPNRLRRATEVWELDWFG
jgi:hypothetical protein